MLNTYLKSVTDQYMAGKISRRNFLVSAGVFSGSVTIGSLLGYFYKNSAVPVPYTKSQDEVITHVQEHLFPKSKYVPGASDLNALYYLHFVLSDPEIDKDNKYVLINGVDWLEEVCISTYERSFTKLNFDEKEVALQKLEESNRGSRWLSLNLSYIFEALLSDPLYGGNPDEIGWKWLGHCPGLPRPSSKKLYGKI